MGGKKRKRLKDRKKEKNERKKEKGEKGRKGKTEKRQWDVEDYLDLLPLGKIFCYAAAKKSCSYTQNTLCLQKSIPNIFDCRLKINYRILIIFWDEYFGHHLPLLRPSQPPQLFLSGAGTDKS